MIGRIQTLLNRSVLHKMLFCFQAFYSEPLNNGTYFTIVDLCEPESNKYTNGRKKNRDYCH